MRRTGCACAAQDKKGGGLETEDKGDEGGPKDGGIWDEFEGGEAGWGKPVLVGTYVEGASTPTDPECS